MGKKVDILEFVSWYFKNYPDQVLSILNRVENAEDKDAEIRNICSECDHKGEKAYALLTYLFLKFGGEKGWPKLEAYLVSGVENGSGIMQKNAAMSLINYVNSSIQNNSKTIEEFETDIAINGILGTEGKSSRIKDLALQSNNINSSHKEVKSDGLPKDVEKEKWRTELIDYFGEDQQSSIDQLIKVGKVTRKIKIKRGSTQSIYNLIKPMFYGKLFNTKETYFPKFLALSFGKQNGEDYSIKAFMNAKTRDNWQ